MQSGNYPYQSMSPVASQPRPPPPQQQPHPLTHGLGHGDLQAYNVGAQIPLPPQANMLLGSSSQGSASSPMTQNVQGPSGHLVGQNQNASGSPSNAQANLLDNSGTMKIFTGAQNINGAAMTPQQSREKVEPSPLADYQFEYGAPKDPNEYAEYQTPKEIQFWHNINRITLFLGHPHLALLHLLHLSLMHPLFHHPHLGHPHPDHLLSRHLNQDLLNLGLRCLG
jgi:hypothetical protein